MSALVEIKDVCKVYNPGENEVRALDHVSLTIDEQEFVAIIGHSGSGKSTLMNMLGCLDVPTSGEYWLHGQDVSALTDDELSDIRNREIGFIFQGFNLIPNLTAVENVELPLIYRGVSRSVRQELSREALKKVGLEHRMDHKPSEMSGGQQQRVAIARAIAQAPPVILADEPTGNLDSNSTKEIMDILKGLHNEGRTVILITHDNDIAAQAKRVIKIKDGKVESDSGQIVPADSRRRAISPQTRPRRRIGIRSIQAFYPLSPSDTRTFRCNRRPRRRQKDQAAPSLRSFRFSAIWHNTSARQAPKKNREGAWFRPQDRYTIRRIRNL